MSAHRDQYDFSRPSTSGRAGFEPIADSETGLHLFHFNDQNGQPLLFSQPYESPAKRDNGIDSVEKNRSVPGRVVTSKVEGGFAVIVRAGNNQEIARSRPYATAELSDAVKNIVIGLAVGGEAAQKEEKAAAQPHPVAAPKTVEPVSSKAETAARHAFKISFYQTGENEAFQGKIEHAASNEKAVFTGADLDAIGSFIQKIAPGMARPQASAMSKPAQSSGPVTAFMEMRPKTAAPVVEEKPIAAEKKPAPAADTPMKSGEPVYVVIGGGKVAQPQPARRMRTIAVANLRFTGVDTSPVVEENEDDSAVSQVESSHPPTVRTTVSAAQAIVNAALRPATADSAPGLTQKTCVITPQQRFSEAPKASSSLPAHVFVLPEQQFKPMKTGIPARLIERVLDPAGSSQKTVSNAPPLAPAAMPPVAAKPAAPKPVAPKSGTTTHFIGEAKPKTAVPRAATSPAIRRVLDPGTIPANLASTKRSVYYVG